jgi:hypothetical protein
VVVGDASDVDMGIGKFPVSAWPLKEPNAPIHTICPDVISPAVWAALGTVILPFKTWASSSVNV